MSLLDAIRRNFNPNYKNTTYVVGYSELPNTIKNIFPSSGTNNRTVTICSRIIANTVASIPINIYKDVDGFKEVVKGDIRYRTLHHNPNGYTNRFVFWHTMELAKQEHGNAFALIHKFPKSIELEFIHPDFFVKTYFDKGFLKYSFKSDSGERIYDASELIHFKRDSIDGIMGVKPNDILCEEIKRSYLANKTVTNFYENDGKSRLFLKTVVTNGDTSKLDEKVGKFRKEAGGSYYNEKNELVYGDLSKYVSFPQLPGNTEIQEIQNEINDALYLATIQDSDLKIAAYYGIPPHYLNIMQAQKNNNVEALQLDFKSSTIQNILSSNRQELEMKLLTTEEVDNEMSIEYNTMSIVELDHDTRMKGYESLQKTAFMTPNEVRRIEGMSPIEGGDEHFLFDQMTTIKDLTKDSSAK